MKCYNIFRNNSTNLSIFPHRYYLTDTFAFDNSNPCLLYCQRTAMMMQPDDMSSDALQSEPMVERKEVVSTFEDAYRCIKEATGVTNIQVGMSAHAAFMV